MTLPQLVFALYFSLLGAYLSIILSRVLKQNGTVLHKIDDTMAKMDEGFRKMDERAEQRHQDVIELLKKGFGDLGRDIRGLKA